MITRYPRPVEEAMRYTFSTLNERQRRLFAASEALNSDVAEYPTWHDSLNVIEGPFGAASVSCVILIHFCRLIERQKKGWPPTLFDSFSRNRQGLSTNRRSPHSGRSRPRRRSLANLSRPRIAEELLRQGFR